MQKVTPISDHANEQKPGASALVNGKGSSFFTSVVQPKLSINQPNDVYEQEADAMAEKVMHAPVNDSAFFKPAPGLIQRKCAECEKEEEKVQMKETTGTAGGITAPPIVNDVVNSTGGQSLDGNTKNFMESRFNEDFGDVLIHNDPLAHQSSDDIDALAYTHGNHIVFGKGEYQPGTDSGKQLLAHELAHVVQQRSATGMVSPKIMRQTKPPGRMQSVTANGKKYEVRRDYMVITPEQEKFLPPTLKGKIDSTNVYFEIEWCTDTRGKIMIGTNLPAQATDLFQKISTAISNGSGEQGVLDEINRFNLTPFINAEVAKSGKWSFSVQTNITIDSSGDVTRGGGSLSVSTGSAVLSATGEAGKDSWQVGVNVKVPFGGGAEKFDCKKQKIPARIKTIDTCELLTPEHTKPETTVTPGIDEKSAFIYFTYAKDIIEDEKTKPETDNLLALIKNGYTVKKVIGYTSPEGPKPQKTKGFVGNDELSAKRAKKAFDKVIEICSAAKKDKPEINCGGITLTTEQIAASELYSLSKEGKSGVEEVEGNELVESTESQFLESPEEQRFVNDPDFKAKLAKARTPRQKAELLYPLLRRAKIILEKPISITETKDVLVPAGREDIDCSSVPGYDDIKLNWDINDNLMRTMNIK